MPPNPEESDRSQSPQGDRLKETWDAVREELQGQSELPNSDIPTLTHKQRAFLRQAKPIFMFEDYLLVSTPDLITKQVVEHDLGASITKVLSRTMGRPFSLAVSIDPSAAKPEENSPAAAPPEQPSSVDPIFEQESSFRRPPEEEDTTASESWQVTYVSDPPESPAAGYTREAPVHEPLREASLNPRHTFDSFVIGSSNRFAHSAAVAVAENPAKAYNPLFISGGSGLGKTHLLHAAGNYAQLLQKSLRIKYVSSEEFTNDYINSVRDYRQESFKRRYRNLDVLMVDDIQFLQGKEGTQEEFFHTFNALHQANKQIILSSDRPPKELTTLEERLRTRFQAGLIADIQPPDLETRIAILMKKAEIDGTRVDRDVLEFIASRYESSIRELEGALIRISAYSSLIDEPIDMAMAQDALQDILPHNDVEITPSKIIEVTAEFFDITTDRLIGSGKTRAVAHARQIAMYLCRELTELSLPKIGAQFGGKDHTTVMYANRKIRDEMTEKRATYNEIQQITQRIKNRSHR